MKNPVFISILFSAIIILCGCEYKSSDRMPEFPFLLMDSVTIFNTNQISNGNLTALMYFSPDCEHCQREFEGILRDPKLPRALHFYLITNDPLDRIRAFSKHFKLHNYKNIVLGQDYEFFFIRYFHPKGTPYLAIYDAKKQLRAVFEGETTSKEIDKVIDTF